MRRMTADRKLHDTRQRAYRSMGLAVKEAMASHTDRADHIRMIAQDCGVDHWSLEVKTYDRCCIATWISPNGIDCAAVIPDGSDDAAITAAVLRPVRSMPPDRDCGLTASELRNIRDDDFRAKARAVYDHHKPDPSTMEKFIKAVQDEPKVREYPFAAVGAYAKDGKMHVGKIADSPPSAPSMRVKTDKGEIAVHFMPDGSVRWER